MLFDLKSFYKNNFKFILTCTICLLAIIAWMHRFIQDDAFISFRYAANLVNGSGLVWNPNERVEGYTNFLWTIFISGGIFIGIEPILFSFILGILFFCLSNITTYKIAKHILQSDHAAFVIMLLLGLNYTFISFATGGLETQMQTAFLLIGAYYSFSMIESNTFLPKNLFCISFTFSLALLTRLDSGIIILPIISVIAFKIYSISIGNKIKLISYLVIPMFVIIGVWFSWKLSYYGDILPNTFYLKASSSTSPLKGLKFVSTFFFSYLLMPVVIFLLFGVKRIIMNRNTILIIISVATGLWILYLIKIGGDFMEFRLFVPVMPFLFLLFGWMIFVYTKPYFYRWLMVFLIFFGSVHHMFTFDLDPIERIEPVRNLHNHLYAKDQNWSGIGKSLKYFFLNTPNVSIGVTAAGAIPYYSGLPSIDMYGLNDRYLARKGNLIGDTPGHQKMSSFDYLIERGVNLVIAHPMVMKIDEEVKHFPVLPKNPNDIMMPTKVIEIPLDKNYKFLALYLTPNVTVDSIIKQNNWKIHLMANK
ncbi:MAG: hypothetical protein HY964_05060 [Ignavibacteriales bacterium]|nr:hypothetical protein [Ignavibacteriales bacterium]